MATLKCVTGALSMNVTELKTAEVKLGTRLRTNEILTIHSGRKGHPSYGGTSFIAIASEPACRQRHVLLELTVAGIAFAFYSPAERMLVDHQVHTYTLTTSKSKIAASFIASYSSRTDLLLLVITSFNLRMESSPELLGALKACGGSTMLHSLGPSSGGQINANYALVARCSDRPRAGYSANLGLEVFDSLSADIEINIDEYYFFPNGESKAAVNFTYDPSMTPSLIAMSRTHGTTAGGTTVILNITGTPSFTTHNVSVSLGGVTCAVRDSEIGTYRGLNLCR